MTDAAKLLDRMDAALAEARSARTNRILELYALAKEEGEELNEASVRDALSLLEILPPDRQPYIFSLESGNIRIMWENGWRTSLEFKGGGAVELVSTIPRPLSGASNGG